MADAKQILVIDDHFEMLEFLRSMLELSNQDFEVRAVPSGEEGVLELMRMKFDLIISDVRLPGMSGFDLVRRIRGMDHDTPVIMITAYSSDQGRQEAKELGVFKYFEKPLDTDNMLTAVFQALHVEQTRTITAVSNNNGPVVSSNVQKRLDTLRTDTGSIQLMLASKEGELIYETGSHRLDLPALAKIIARNIQDSFLLANMLGTKEPFSLQYHAGEQIELYCANVGETHFLTLFFDASARRGRIGTIWVFTQRAISDLQVMLAIETPIDEETLSSSLAEFEYDSVPEIEEEAELIPSQPAFGEMPDPDPLPSLQLDQLEVSESELAALFASESDNSNEVDLDSFWSDALKVNEPTPSSTGLSIEEAQKKGLFRSSSEEEEEEA